MFGHGGFLLRKAESIHETSVASGAVLALNEHGMKITGRLGNGAPGFSWLKRSWLLNVRKAGVLRGIARDTAHVSF